ncbi:MAG: glycosyltransferase family 2 protein [Rhodocyclaceae bacterium]
MARSPVSAVLITRDAAAQLGNALASVAFCDEIVVVDSGSTDGTPELARSRGARVLTQPWLGYGAQKRFAVSQAAHDWVLCIDADEQVSERLRESILEALAQPRFAAYRFARCNRFMGRYLRHGEGYPDWSLRLFDRRAFRWSEAAVHEKVIGEGEVGRLAGDLLHESAESLEDYFAKQNRYSTLAAQAEHERGVRPGTARLLLSPLARFLKFYFLRLGLLDGLPGLVHILIGCQASFAKYAKIAALRRKDGDG